VLIATSLRERVVDFTTPFWDDHLVAVMKKRHRTQFQIHSFENLADQSTVKYGILDSGTVKEMFRYSQVPVYRRMWQQMMDETISSWVATTQQGLQRVLASSDEQPWAFVTQSSSVTYYARQRCDLDVIMDQLPFFPAAMAVPTNSPYRESLTLAILEMREFQELYMLRAKWFPQRDCD